MTMNPASVHPPPAPPFAPSSGHAGRVPSGALATGARWLAYALLATALLGGVLASLREHGVEALLGESGLIELAQLGLLGTGAIGLVLAARSHRARHGLMLVATLAALGLVRELDGPLDASLFHGAWKPVAAVVAGTAAVLGAGSRRELPGSLARLARSPGAGLLLAAGLVVAVQSRLIGMQAAWRGAFGDAFDRSAPRLAEELVELGGYTLFLFAALELLVEARRVGRRAGSDGGVE